MSDYRYKWRMALICLMVVSVFIGLATRIYFLHVIPPPQIEHKVSELRHYEKKILMERGCILDRTGNSLAIDLQTHDLCADPANLLTNNPVFVCKHLARILNQDATNIFHKINKPTRRYARLARFLHTETVASITRLQFQHIWFENSIQRTYPHHDLMCHVIGFANWERTGSAGIEQELNRFLRGREGILESQKDGRHREIYSRRIIDLQPQQGADIQLALDRNIQFIVEKHLDEAVEQHNAKAGICIVQQVKTGEILAMASRPKYDPNLFRCSSSEDRRNRAISYTYEPGSTFKIVVIAGALNEKLVTPDTIIFCENGYWYYGGRPLRDYHAYGNLTVADVLKKSSNIGAAKLALKLGEKRLEEYIRAFGFGRVSGIQLPGEEQGIFYDHSKWSKISFSRLAMGHEITVTALQMINALSAIGNRGQLMRPLVVDSIMDYEGRIIKKTHPQVISKPISEDTARTMAYLLSRIPEPGGTGTRARMDGYKICGKTGTAQKPILGKGYSHSAHMSSFMGFLPLKNPEIAIIIVIDEPQPLHTGGLVAAPAFKKIAEETVRYLDIIPDTDPSMVDKKTRKSMRKG